MGDGGGGHWLVRNPDVVAPSRTVGVSAYINLPLHHKVQEYSSGTGSPGWSRKKGRKTVVMVWRSGCSTAVSNVSALKRTDDSLGLSVVEGRDVTPIMSTVFHRFPELHNNNNDRFTALCPGLPG